MATDFFKIGQATGQQFTDVSGAVQKGLEAGLKPFAEYEKSRKERVNALGRILQTTPNLEELPKIPAQYSPKISEWASNAKNEYADAARALVQMSPETAEYREAVQKMNNIKTAFANLDNQLNGIREERIEYLDDYQNGMVSKGFKNSDIEAAYGANGAIAEIDANGNVSMTGNEGKAFIWSERQEHYNVNPYMQKSMVGLSDSAKENGLKGISFTQDEYKERLKAIMSNPETGNIRALKSLVYDDLDGINALNIDQTNPEILAMLEAETPDLPAIKQKLVDILAPALVEVNQKSIGEYNEALQTKNNKSIAEDPTKKAQEFYDIFKQNPIGLYEEFTGYAPSYNKETGSVKIFEQNELGEKTLAVEYNLKNAPERNRFYKKLLEYSGYAKRATAGNEDIKLAFDTVVRDATKQKLSTKTPIENSPTEEAPEVETGTEIIEEELQESANIELKPGEQGYFEQEKAKGRSAKDIRLENKAAQLINKYIQ